MKLKSNNLEEPTRAAVRTSMFINLTEDIGGPSETDALKRRSNYELLSMFKEKLTAIIIND